MQIKDIEGYEGLYKITTEGIVISCKKNVGKGCGYTIQEKIKKTKVTKNGYVKVNLKKKSEERTFFIHRLVAESFILNLDNKPQVNHKDGNKYNNCVGNLEWVTAKENAHHAQKIGLRVVAKKVV